MKSVIVLTAIFVLNAPSFAYDIESGMWGFEGEVNGKPGRGIQIDEQGGNVVIATYFGYRTDGSALFLQASGPIVNDEFTGALSEYQNGPSLGGEVKSGELLSVVGNIRIIFSSPTTAKISLPGEEEKVIRRLQFEDSTPRFAIFNGASTAGDSSIVTPTRFVFRLSGGNFHLTATTYAPSPQSECIYSGSYSLSGKGIYSQGNATCTYESRPASVFNYKTGLLTVSKSGVYNGDFFQEGTDYLQSSHIGICTTGVSTGGTVLRCLAPKIPE